MYDSSHPSKCSTICQPFNNEKSVGEIGSPSAFVQGSVGTKHIFLLVVPMSTIIFTTIAGLLAEKSACIARFSSKNQFLSFLNDYFHHSPSLS